MLAIFSLFFIGPVKSLYTIQHIIKLLKQGEVVALPTETVFGLFVDATNPDAIAKLTALKGRKPHHPYSIMLGMTADIDRYANIPSDVHQSIIDRFMPGPLTLLLPHKNISDDIVMGSESVGVRIPKYPLLNEILQSIDFPLVAPSANPTGLSPAQTIRDIHKYFGKDFPVIGVSDNPNQTISGTSSTVLSLTNGVLTIHREGVLTTEIQDFVDTQNKK